MAQLKGLHLPTFLHVILVDTIYKHILLVRCRVYGSTDLSILFTKDLLHNYLSDRRYP